MDGPCAYFHRDGSVFLGEIANGEKKGFGRNLYLNGDVYEGQYGGSQKHGRGLYHYYRTGQTYEGEWRLGVKEKYGM